MKTAIIILGDIRQIILTPENKQEELVLSMLTVDDTVEVLSESVTYHRNMVAPSSYNISECQGGYLRQYEDTKSRVLVIKPKKNTYG